MGASPQTPGLAGLEIYMSLFTEYIYLTHLRHQERTASTAVAPGGPAERHSSPSRDNKLQVRQRTQLGRCLYAVLDLTTVDFLGAIDK